MNGIPKDNNVMRIFIGNTRLPPMQSNNSFRLPPKITVTRETKQRPLVPLQSLHKKSILLPLGFMPTPYTVILGQGNRSKKNIGNLRLRAFASLFLDEYATADNSTGQRRIKTEIVSIIVSAIRNACPVGGFVKLGKDGRWYEVTDRIAREKVGYTFRDLLCDQYQSSSKSKVLARRRQRNTELKSNSDVASSESK